MKAIVIIAAGEPHVLQIEDRPVPVFKEDEVLIKVYAAGINRPDIMQRLGKYPAPAGYSLDIPGLEVAGEIVSCGKNVKRWRAGDKVCALLGGGAYAEFAVADEHVCLPIPKNCTFSEAASLPETIFTVWHNVFSRGKLVSGENFLVHGGTSGIGITAIQLAKAFGAKVFTTAGSDEKCNACSAFGADKAINYKSQDFENELKEDGVDMILDMIGGDYFNKNMNILKADGRLIFINAMHGKDAKFDIMKLMQKRITISGSTLRSRSISFKAQLASEIENMVWPLIGNGKFKPVIYKEFPLEEACNAHTLMESSKHIGKIVLKII